MTVQLKSIIKDAQTLSPVEQVELITAVSNLLQKSYYPTTWKHDFWETKTLQQRIDEKKTIAIENIENMAGNFWPKEENLDDFLSFTYQERLQNRNNSL